MLKNLDGTYIQPLTYAFDISAELHYNETSQLEFSIPAYANGEETPHYKDIVGMRIVDWLGVGQFILVNPSTENDGVKEIKKCKAYSLEYELTYKSTYIPEGTYEFWNPVAPESTIIGMILSDYPSWSVGSIDSDLIGVYRTFDANSQNAYDLMKNELQEKYQCVFDFDTYNRTVNVRKVSSIVEQKPVYLSTKNLIKNISVEEDTENIFTTMDVNGAEGVDIRSVNPMGNNVIYNLDYFMYQIPEEAEGNRGNSYFSQSMIDKWSEWKESYASSQRQFYNITIDKVLKEAKLEMAKAELTELNGELSSLTELQSVYVEAAAQGVDKSSDLARVKREIADKEDDISDKQSEIETLEESIESAAQDQKRINSECKFENFFNESELIALDKYMKQTNISEESFVYQEVNSYVDADASVKLQDATVDIRDAKISGAEMESGRMVYSIFGGSIELTDGEDNVVKSNIVRGSLEKKTNYEYLLTLYLSNGTYVGDVEFNSAGLTIYGEVESFDTDVTGAENSYIDGTYISMTSSENSSYFTRNVGEYEKRSIEWSLLEFGEQELESLAWPSYSFDVDSANFLALEDFVAFKNKFSLGDKVYIDINGKILTPIAIGVQVDFSDPSKFKLMFGDKYSLKDSAFELVDLLEQSVQMGKTVATNKLSYNAFIDSGASTAVKDYMTSALDASKQAVIAGANQAVQFDGSGLRLRKAIDGGYDDEQIWMINNNIVFTDDGWSSAKMAIGKVIDPNLVTDDNPYGEAWGIVAPNIVGTMLAGENLIIESAKKDGTNAVFRVDADGAKLYNSNFDLVKALQTGSNDKAWIKFDPNLGMIGGLDSIANPLYAYDDDGNVIGIKNASGNTLEKIPSTVTEDNMPNASFWLDMNGNAFYKGTVYAEDGVFRGDVYADNGTFKGTVDATTFKLDGVDISNIFKTEEDPELGDVLKIGQITIDGTTGTISWDNVSTSPIEYMYNSTASDSGAHSDMRSTDYYRKEKFGGAGTWSAWYQFRGKNGSDGEDFSGYDWIKQTYIDGSSVKSPTMMANQVYVSNHFAVGTVDGSDYTTKGYMGYATGKIPGDIITEGIAISTEPDLITYETSGHYLIVTTDGVRMQAPGHCIFVTSGGAFYDNEPLGVARFG